MHQVRKSVRENRLSDQTRITEPSYLPYIVAGSIWVAEVNDRIAGFAAIDAAASSVWALFVDPDFEGAGVGRALHAKMLAWAQRESLEPLTLTTEQSSRAVRFYSEAGWTQCGVTAEGEVIFERSVLS
jgi:GNAT superfamily N-acetyltransferase